MNLDRKYRWFKTRVLGVDWTPTEYIFRGLTANEIRIASSKKPDVAAEDFILKTCVKNLENLEDMPGGSCVVLLQHIYRISGLTDEVDPIREAIEWIQSDEGTAEGVAISMIAGLSLETLNNCDQYDRARYLIIGKFMFETIYGVDVKKASFSRSQEGGSGSQYIPPKRVATENGFVEVPGAVVDQFTWSKQR